MGSNSAAAVLQLPIRLRGIQLGRPIDLLVDVEAWNVLGFVVLCADESQRFLPFAASQPRADAIEIGSALLLLEDAGFYEQRGTSYRSLLGTDFAGGMLRDVELTSSGHVVTLVIERDGERFRVPAPARAAA
jgi:hypothetical protein